MMRFIGIIGILVTMSGCITTVSNPEDNVRAQAWDQVQHLTDVSVVGENRLRLEARSAPGYGVEALEMDLLARAAGESVRRGAPRFVILYVEYRDSGLGDALIRDRFGDGARSWIGTYEDLVSARSEADTDGSLGRSLRFKKISAVVRLLAPGEAMDRASFDAEDAYISLITDRIERRNIQPQRYISLRR